MSYSNLNTNYSDTNTANKNNKLKKKQLFINVSLDTDQIQPTEDTSISARSLIFQEGKAHEYVYIVNSGWGFIYKTVSNNGKRQILRFLLPGDMIGFQTDSKGLMTYSASSITGSVLSTFPRDQIKPLIRKEPELAIRLLEMGSRDVSLCQNHLIAAGRKSARESIAFVLLELFYRVKFQIPEDYTESTQSVIFPITQEDIGDAIGLTNIHVNRVIKELINEKLILCNKRKLTILDEERLSKLADFKPEMIFGYD